MNAKSTREATTAFMTRAVDRNLASHASDLHRFVAGTTVLRIGDFQIADSGFQHDTYNTVTRVDHSRGYRPDDVRAVSAYIRSAERPFSWWVTDDTALQSAARVLAEWGFIASDTEDVMVADLRDGRAATRAPEPVAIEAVTESRQLNDYARVLAANWNPAADDITTFMGSVGIAAFSNASLDRTRFFVAYLHGEAVAGAEVHNAAGVAGLYGIATREPFRGRGIASALVGVCLDWARREGCETAVLQATKEGSGIYRRHGFTSVRTCTEFAIDPQRM